MKKIISFFTVIFLCTNAILTSYADSSSFVNDAISVVVDKIEIPDNYTEFSSRVTIEQNAQYAYLSWYGDNYEDQSGGQINVTVDGKYRIVEFSQYFYGEYTGDYKLSDINRQDAEKIASDFASVVCPEFYSHTKPESSGYNYNRNFEPYEVVFYRYENNLPCYDNYISVVVNAYNGSVSSLTVKWYDYDKIYSPLTRMSLDNAKVNMFDSTGLVLEYAKDDYGNLYTRYASMADGINYINAYTGSVLNTGILSEGDGFKNASSAEKIFDVNYSEEFDYSKCVKIIEKNEYISFDDSYKLTGVYCLEDEFGKYAMFDYADESGNTKTYIADVQRGDIRYYYQQSEIADENKSLSDAQCRRIAEMFCEKYESGFIDYCVLLNYNNTRNQNGEDIYYYNFARVINGIVYDGNGVVVGVSRATGEIVSVSSGWEVMEPPSYSNSISEADAFEKYIDAVDFKLQYKTCMTRDRKIELRPVFAVNPKYNLYVNAVSGELIDASGRVYNEDFCGYSDTANDAAENQINVLLSCGIFDAGEEFRPNEYVNLCDFLLWICRTVDCYIYKDISEIADRLVMSGLVSYDELKENAPINIETGIKYIVSYLGYDEVAVLEDTYVTGFVDEGMISPELLGYAAIAKGLKIFNGNAFLPKEYMKRNVAAQILYNLITN